MSQTQELSKLFNREVIYCGSSWKYQNFQVARRLRICVSNGQFYDVHGVKLTVAEIQYLTK